MFCTQCGARLDAGARFCASCGAPVATIPALTATNTGTAAVSLPLVGSALSLPRSVPVALTVAAILYGLAVLLTLFLAGLQFILSFVGAAGGGTPVEAGNLLFGSLWNGALGVLDCFIAQRILTRKRFGYSWGFGSGALNTVFIPILFLFNLATGTYLTAFFQLFLAPLALASAVLLYLNRHEFPPK